MKYRLFPGTDVKASTLGLGCMRFPMNGEEVDKAEAIRMIHSIIDRGVNYIDTAYGYHQGQSEKIVGEALEGGWREKVTLTTKLPVWKISKYEDMEETLDEQLARLRTDHVDFYLLHALDINRYHQMRDLGVKRFLEEMVKKGKIRYPGFSFHDDAAAFEEIAMDYDWKLIQVQMNILDEFNQATYEGVQKFAAERGIGVVVMEPLRGGALAGKVPGNVQAIYDQAEKKCCAVEWAFKWLLDKPEFVTILSGMSNMEQIEDNLRIFDSADCGCLTDAERTMMTDVRKAYEMRVRVGCTGCEYCQPCPKGVKIPNIFRGIDNACMFGEASDFAPRYGRMIEKKEDASQCIGCGACEKLCPQHFEIRKLLNQIKEEFK